MSGRIQRAIQRALETVREMNGTDVVYVRGSTRLGIRATKSDADVSTTGSDGVTTTHREIAWRVVAGDLVILGQIVRPEPGDRIEEVIGGVTRIYEAMARGKARCFEPIGPYDSGWKIFVKLVEER